MKIASENLHSNMVRFIMRRKIKVLHRTNGIYIPIWLDLLYKPEFFKLQSKVYLHSNMVRFIILHSIFLDVLYFVFTFQYG